MTLKTRSVTRSQEDSLLEQLAELDHFYQTGPVGLCLLDRNLRYVRINDRLAAINGVPAGAHIGRSIHEVVPEIAPTLKPMLERVLETSEPVVDLEIRGSTPAQPDAERDWLASFYPLTARDGSVKGVSVVILEITESKRAEARLLESERRYRDLVENSQGLICTHDLEGKLLSVNPAAARSLRYKPEEMVGMNLADVLVPDARHLIPEYLRDIRSEGVASGLMNALSKSGEGRIWLYRNVLQSVEGQEPYVIGHAVDISDQKRAERALRDALDYMESRVEERTRELKHANEALRAEVVERESAQRALRHSEEGLRQLLETTNVVPWEAEAKTGRLTYVGPQAVGLLGYPLERWFEPNFRPAHTHPDDRKRVLDFGNEHSRTSDPYDFHYRMLAADDSIVWIHELVSVNSVEGEPVTLRGFMFDITNRQRADEEARELRERMARVTRLTRMGELAGGIAHEVNQPLTAIATYAQACRRLMRAQSVDPEVVLGAIDSIVDEALRAGRIIHRVRDLMVSGDNRREFQNVNDLIREVTQLAKVDERWGDRELRMDLAESLPRVKADSVQIQQVLLNLIGNSLEAIETAGRTQGVITITSSLRPDSAIEVAIADEGAGVEAATAERIFQPFFTTKEEGMGLGLSLCRSIIDSHGGRLWFSRNDGVGTTFHFTLPLPVPDESVTA